MKALFVDSLETSALCHCFGPSVVILCGRQSLQEGGLKRARHKEAENGKHWRMRIEEETVEVREWRQRKGTKVQRWWSKAKWQTKYSKRWKKRRWIQGPEDKETLFLSFHQTASRIYAYIYIKKTFPSRTVTHLPSLHRRWADRKCHELAQTLTNMALSASRSPLGFLPRSELLHAVATGRLHGKTARGKPSV